ncbi:ribonuclease HII [Pyrococcus furiosus DSM 3638]|uniref:Ribonuclease HII n=3 Tax=Pyrococcus furiosus TaxID=2261 RepID=RNH2_PYRFU|nr:MULTISPECIES: ribonuclease HII [Pyrococcus]Q8U036.1 RecName: Full=Ribonuclease HII; Short=RNase HII [Pyrococcus furiosus DSM 3638]AAL81905.1 RNaseH II [Pyrococcus furiosus DSM 3638]AFN04860.1 ribonuclease HII [Pyrococcus furiosus COM1]MDK2870251.1 ribonuclease [Pyrococcus sp.]QEK79383.1 ribonuclease HII [Pyrococcus furiosus DSM 3638]
MKIGGIDEAGRGPAIGPLVVATVVVDEKNIEKLRNIGVKDSKQLTPHERKNLFSQITSIADDYKIVIVSPEEIDNRSGTMNELEVEKFALALNSLQIKPALIYADAADVDANRFASLIERRLNYKAKIIAEHKADAKYPVVSAASILAKVVRDEEIEKLKKQYGDFGSGYPSDPKTKKWLEEYYKKHNSFPPIVRRTWETVRKIEESIKAKKSQLTLDKFFKKP